MKKLLFNFTKSLKYQGKQQFSCVKSVQELETFWDSFSEKYVTQDNSINLFYFSLLNMIKFDQRNKILEVGAGGGYLLNHALKYKKPSAEYFATDLSENMLKILCRRMNLQDCLSNQQVSQNLYNLTIQKANGEALQYQDDTFDCYISNLCLQLTSNPELMIKESYRVLQKGGSAGFSVWGEKDKSLFYTILPSVLSQFGYQEPPIRSNFHLNNREKLIEMMQNAGFKNVICWNQFAPFHHTTEQEINNFLNFPNNLQAIESTGENKEKVKQAIYQKLKEHIMEKNLPLGLDGLLVIGTK
ncbi:UbiE/COQ5 methyltransferase (macronuclear) [Tetrahymena thermophila SB210]|uniref:UbiE/COQ5 methyltransferase n=1 Tax=Tetrahymena thermophila (strain SB210) TaxID=312017 RepID=Q23EY2_TETTS|nr:UbiE/COQ5 methyltransferase [Tetrahymena thermophila SB210]EAR95123.1 UbiE/COQ5 methyltransferase [Tetrahymena thermophila SB210]|eukprot:XP_001015368.1 UbiE/COQ5 methyltransferase [Tetrahymena thermophila SB210]